MNTTAQGAAGRRALVLVSLAALIEGFDLQAAGVAVPGLAPAFGLTPAQIGTFFAAATFGQIFGALAGGQIADRFGRRAGLALSLAAFGIFSFATAFATSVDQLVLMRFLTGVGLGGAMPNLIAIAIEAADPARRGRAVAFMYAGLPMGGAIASFLSVQGLHGDWRLIFIVGGLLPVALVIAVLAMLPRLAVERPAGGGARPGIGALFGGQQITSTLLLWTGFFFGLLVLYLLLNWLPQLLVSKGFDRADAGWVQLAFNLGGVAGTLAGGRMLDSERPALMVGGCFVFMLAALVLMGAMPAGLGLTLVGGALVGAGILGVQAVMYALAPQIYPAALRGTGTGIAVAVGRLGSVAGPMFAAMLIAGGSGASDVLIALVPIGAVSGVATVSLIALRGRRRLAQPA